ncbi:Avirulence (Avh) protein [Phytophthora megakarya]|uniref:Avirulence (Avh) protein n=1 Tax=Phytophthora megakarya TaxID=4795 RepID=A0A225UZS3_9STRA|nr:Avirulence (Avh) protein [Phytophthora megakarya]
MFGIKLIPGKISKYVKDQKLTKQLNKHDNDIDTMFSKLELSTAGEKLFESGKFVTWAKYVDNYNKKSNKRVFMLPTLRRQYDDEALIKMLEAATQAQNTQRIGTILQTEQMKIWKSSGLSLEDLFKRYKLDRDANPFSNPAINILGRYSDEFNTGKKTTLLKTLQKHYSDSELSQMLEAATLVKSTKDLATNLQTKQMTAWKRAGLSTDKLFKIYKLDEGVASMLSNPMLKHWLKYVNDFNPGKKTTLISTLRTHYTDSPLSQMLIAARKVPSTQKNARILEDKLLQSWFVEKKSLDDVFKFLKLEKGADDLFDSMQLKTWLRYEDMVKFDTKTNPNGNQKTLTEILMGHYSNQALESLFNSAKTTYGENLAAAVKAELPAKSLV